MKSWTVTILTEELAHKTFTQPASAEVLHGYLNRTFPGATYNSVYEAGFSGFWAHYKFVGMEINNIVINPADVPTSQKEQLHCDLAGLSNRLKLSALNLEKANCGLQQKRGKGNGRAAFAIS